MPAGQSFRITDAMTIRFKVHIAQQQPGQPLFGFYTCPFEAYINLR